MQSKLHCILNIINIHEKQVVTVIIRIMHYVSNKRDTVGPVFAISYKEKCIVIQKPRIPIVQRTAITYFDCNIMNVQ